MITEIEKSEMMEVAASRFIDWLGAYGREIAWSKTLQANTTLAAELHRRKDEFIDYAWNMCG